MENNRWFITLPNDNNTYIKTDDITKATHWVGYEESIFDGLLNTEPNVAYEICYLYEKEFNTYDYYIKARFSYSMAYMGIEGDFLIKH